MGILATVLWVLALAALVAGGAQLLSPSRRWAYIVAVAGFLYVLVVGTAFFVLSLDIGSLDRLPSAIFGSGVLLFGIGVIRWVFAERRVH